MLGAENHFTEDFTNFPLGQLPYDYSPTGEYHCIVPKGMPEPWVELTTHHKWRFTVGWWSGEEHLKSGSTRFLEHCAEREEIPSIYALPKHLIADGQIELDCSLNSLRQNAGFAFRMQKSD